MAITKISELAELTQLTAGDYFIVNDENLQTKSISYANLGTNVVQLLAVTDLTLTGDLTLVGGVSFSNAADLNGPVNINGSLNFSDSATITGIDVSDVENIDLTTPATNDQVLAYNANDEVWRPRSTDSLPERPGDLFYAFDTGLDQNPGDGNLRFNSASVGDITLMYVSHVDAYGNNLAPVLLKSITEDIRVIVQDKADETSFYVAQVNSSALTFPTYYGFPVSIVDSGNPINDNAELVIQIITDGIKKAPLASPVFSGVPQAPTAVAGTNSTQIATTAFVTTAVANGGGGGGAVDSVNGQTGAVFLTASDFNLGNVDNTSDADKPVSNATATALTSKADILDLDNKEDISEYLITANGSSDYIFNGPGFDSPQNDPDIYLVRGRTYKFTNNMGAHPFQIQSTAGSGGIPYSEGLDQNAVSNGTITWEVQMDTPDELFYQCTAHPNMQGRIFVMSNKTSRILDKNVPSSASDTGEIGEIRFGNQYLYICTSANTWKRVLLETWS